MNRLSTECSSETLIRFSNAWKLEKILNSQCIGKLATLVIDTAWHQNICCSLIAFFFFNFFIYLLKCGTNLIQILMFLFFFWLTLNIIKVLFMTFGLWRVHGSLQSLDWRGFYRSNGWKELRIHDSKAMEKIHVPTLPLEPFFLWCVCFFINSICHSLFFNTIEAQGTEKRE